MFIRHYLERHGLRLEDLGVKHLVIGTWFDGVTRRLASEAGLEAVTGWPYGGVRGLYSGEVDGRPLTVTTFPVGAPGTVAVMEELLACGAQRIVGLGMAGSLQPDVPAGSVILPGPCLREEGTSTHYLSPEEAVFPDPLLHSALAGVLTSSKVSYRDGPHWTTDAIYREFVWKIEKYRAEGVLGVDMETSAMYALGLFRRVPVANVLVISDELWHEWRPAFYSDELRQGMRRVCRALLQGTAALAGG